MGQEFLHLRGKNLCHAAAKFSLGSLDSFMEPENGPVSLLNAYAVNLFSRLFISFLRLDAKGFLRRIPPYVAGREPRGPQNRQKSEKP